jgi:hypothetical protein
VPFFLGNTDDGSEPGRQRVKGVGLMPSLTPFSAICLGTTKGRSFVIIP